VAGYRVVVFFRIFPDQVTCELGWVMLEDLPEEEGDPTDKRA